MLELLFVVSGYVLFMFMGYMIIGEVETMMFDDALENGTKYDKTFVDVYDYQGIKHELLWTIFGGE